MDVLLLESHPGLGRRAEAELEAAGHRVLRCTDDDACAEHPHTDRAPCVGLRPGVSCPLDRGHEVAAAVLVRVGNELRPSEHGALCAARNRVPIVVAGDAAGAGMLSSVRVSVHGDLASAVDQAASAGTGHATAVARELLSLGVLGRDDLGGGESGEEPRVVIDVRRSPRRLDLTIWLRDGDPRRDEILRAAGQALRAYDPYTPVVDAHVRLLPIPTELSA